MLNLFQKMHSLFQKTTSEGLQNTVTLYCLNFFPKIIVVAHMYNHVQ
jgi:hypothetical protein